MKTSLLVECVRLCAILGAGSAPALVAQESKRLPAAEGGQGNAILISVQGGPALFNCETPQGRIESKSEGAATATRRLLNTPNLGHAWINAAAGVVEFAFVPVAAGYGAVSSGRAKLPPERLIEAQSELTKTMQLMAEQGNLVEYLLQQTNEMARAIRATAPELSGPGSAFAQVEIRTEQLRLERVDKHDNFALRIITHARLRPAGSGKDLLDRIYEHRSDKAMFIDWTMSGAFESVARSGYEDIAERMAKDIAQAVNGEPLLLGAGYRDSRTKQKDRSLSSEIHPGDEQQQVAMVAFRRSPAPSSAMSAGASLPNDVRAAAYLPIAYQPEAPSFEIHATDKAGLVLQLPQTRSEAITAAQSDTEYALGGLEDDRNFVVQTGAALAAIPLGFWEQSRAMWQGLTAKKIAKARAHLSAVTNQMRPQELIAFAIARNWPGPAGTPILTTSESAKNYRAADFSAPAAGNQKGDCVIQVRVLKAGLVGSEGLNPPLTLNVEARASLVRVADGAEVCAVPVKYRSAAKRFTAWAAQDGKAFRNETDACYRQIGQCAARELQARTGRPLADPKDVLAAN